MRDKFLELQAHKEKLSLSSMSKNLKNFELCEGKKPTEITVKAQKKFIETLSKFCYEITTLEFTSTPDYALLN